MGEVGFASLGVDWRKAMINGTYALIMNTQLKPLERHGVLYYVEQGLMAKTGSVSNGRSGWRRTTTAGSSRITIGPTKSFMPASGGIESHPAVQGRPRGPRLRRPPLERAFHRLEILAGPGPDPASQLVAGSLSRCLAAARGPNRDPSVLAYAESYEHRRADLKTVPVVEGTE